MQTRTQTNPLGPGTRTGPVNWPADALQELARLAHDRGQSLGGLIKSLVRIGRQAETQRAARAAALLVIFLGITAAQWVGRDEVDVRRARASVRVRRNQA